jgi:hypothetical protein
VTSLRPPFFVFGSGRSGTSLLTRMLDAHSAIAVPYESHLYNRIYPLLPRNIDLGTEATRRRLVREILRTGPLQHWSPRPSLDATLAAVRRPGFHGIVEGLLDGWAAGRAKPRWGEKTPQHTLCWRTILNGFPDLKVLHLVRDGRDVALSFRAAPFGPKHAYQAALHWMKYLSAAEKARGVLGERGFLAVRYEDLLESPEGELRRICAFLGEPYEEGMLTFYRQKVDYPTDARNLAQLRRPVRGENREKWRTRLSPREQRIFEALAGDWLERFGYPRVVPGARISRWEALVCRSLEHPPRRLLGMLRNRAGYGYALETLRLKLRLPRLA